MRQLGDNARTRWAVFPSIAHCRWNVSSQPQGLAREAAFFSVSGRFLRPEDGWAWFRGLGGSVGQARAIREAESTTSGLSVTRGLPGKYFLPFFTRDPPLFCPNAPFCPHLARIPFE